MYCNVVIGNHSRRTVYIFIFLQSGMWCSVRINQSIHTEVSIVNFFAMISSIIIDSLAIFSLAFVNSMITPLPYETSTKTVVLLDQFKVILQVSRSISHGVAIFYQKKRFIRILFHVFINLRKSWVHSSNYIYRGKWCRN